jgi:hypothetical protein
MVRLYEGCAQSRFNGEEPKGRNTAQGYPCLHAIADMGARSDSSRVKHFTMDRVRKVGVTYALLAAVPFGESELDVR